MSCVNVWMTENINKTLCKLKHAVLMPEAKHWPPILMCVACNKALRDRSQILKLSTSYMLCPCNWSLNRNTARRQATHHAKPVQLLCAVSNWWYWWECSAALSARAPITCKPSQGYWLLLTTVNRYSIIQDWFWHLVQY